MESTENQNQPLDFLVAQTDLIVNNTDDSGDGSLRKAIEDANSTAGTDKIIFDSSLNNQTITLTSGELLITDAVTIQGLGADKLTISGNNSSRVFKVDDNNENNQVNVSIEGLTITGGTTSGEDDGGGIWNRDNLTLKNTVISDNEAADDGGGIRNDGELTIINSTIADNKSLDTTSQTSGGGGLLNTNKDGALVTIINSTFSGNTGKNGGAIRNDGTLNLTNSTLSGNTASQSGGGLVNTIDPDDPTSSGRATISNSTITNNTAGSELGGGIANVGTLVVRNSIIAGNTANDDIQNTFTVSNIPIPGDITSKGHNLIGSYDGTDFNNNKRDIVGTSSNPINPLLDTLQNNGGLTETHALLSGSPAINSGSNSNIGRDTKDIDSDNIFNELIPFEQRGVGFQRIIDSTVDIGAYEFGNAPFSTSVVEVDAINDSGSYKVGDNIEITVKFTEAVNVDFGIDRNKPSLILETGTNDSSAFFDGSNRNGNGTDTLTFSYSVRSGDESLDLDYISNSALQLNGSTFKDNLGNQVDITLPNPGETNSLSANKDIVIDTKDIIIDTIAPDAPVINLFSNSALNITGSAEANSTIEIFQNGNSVGTTVADNSGNWDFDYTGTTTSGNTYTFTATATDSAGNTSPKSTGLQITVGSVEEESPSVNLSITPTTGTEANGTQIIITATATSAVTRNQTVELSVTGTGITAADYTLSSNTITILDGETTGSVTFTIADDTLAEAAETATFSIINPSSGITLGTATTTNLTIEASDNTEENTDDSDSNSGNDNNTEGENVSSPNPGGNVGNVTDPQPIEIESNNTKLKFSLASTNTNSINEIGLFIVDENGNIDGNEPGSDGFIEAALKQSQILFSTLDNLPNGFNIENTERIVEIDSISRLGFFKVAEGTTETALREIETSGQTNLLISFIDSNNLSNENLLNPEGFTLEFENSDIQLKGIETQETPTKTSKLQGKKELIDLQDITGNISVNVEVYREAAFNNLIGFYKITDENGGIDTDGDGTADFNPNDAGYKNAALENRITSLDLLKTDNQKPITVDGILNGGSILAPFMIVDGTFDEAIDGSAEVYFSFLGANSDNNDHIRLLGDNIFGFEDMINGGDKDFNDSIIKINFGNG